MKEDDFYNHYNLVEDEDIVKAKKKPKSKKPIKMSSIKKGSTYESVSINKEVKKEEILKEEVKDTPSEEFLVEYNIVEEKQQKEEVKTPIYIGFTTRLVIFCILVPILSLLAVIFLYKAFAVDEIVNIRYTEKSIIDYTVYSDDINIYTGENNLYDRSLINKIKLDLKYQFLVNQKSNIILDYKIIEDLVIADKNNPENIFYNESNKLIEKKNELIEDNKKYSLRENIDINYWDYYNKVKQLSENYTEETNSYLDIKLLVNYKSSSNNSYSLKDSSISSIRIPLSDKNISIEKNEINLEKRVNKRPTVHIKSPGYLGLGILSSIGAIFALSQAILFIYSILDQYSEYDKLVHRILRKYKNKIIIKDKVPRKAGKIITNVDNIKILNKVSKINKVPIEYCNINEHNKCQFSVINDKELFIYVIKAIDLEKKD